MNKIALRNKCLIIVLITLLVSCKDKDASSSVGGSDNTETSASTGNSENNGSSFSGKDNTLICLWPKVGLRDIAGRKNAKYISTIYFGETVKFLGETESANNKDYLKVELSDGEQGWVYSYLFSENGKLAVLNKPLALYKRPDIMEFEGNKFKKGDIVVVSDETKGEWTKVSGAGKEDEGWVQKTDGFIYDELDIKLAILYHRAMQEDSESKKIKKLKLITDNPAFQESNFISIVEKALEGIKEYDFSEIESTINSDQLYIVTDRLNARSTPNSEVENVVFQLKKGDVCNIVEKGELETINDKSSHWYKIEFNDNEGWIFGFYTSKK